MTIDARIPLMAAQGASFNLPEIMMQAERIKAMRADREYQQAERERQANSRRTLAELVMGQSPQAPGSDSDFPVSNDPSLTPVAAGAPGAAPVGMQAPQGQAVAKADAWREYVQFDPEGAIDFRKTTQDWQKDQFEQTEKFNNAWLQILSGVYDQASYDRAKNKARALFGRLGQRFDDLQVPEQYDPRLVDQARMEATATKDQLSAIRAERKLDWDIRDDEIDNERMDRNTQSLIDTRDDRLSEYQRANRAREGNQRRGQDLTDTRGRRGQDMTDQRARDGVGGKAKKARPTAVDAKGNKVEFDGKNWVPVK